MWVESDGLGKGSVFRCNQAWVLCLYTDIYQIYQLIYTIYHIYQILTLHVFALMSKVKTSMLNWHVFACLFSLFCMQAFFQYDCAWVSHKRMWV